MDQALRQLIDISRVVGEDPALVSGASGNTSVKADDRHFSDVLETDSVKRVLELIEKK